ncbi:MULTISPECIES: GIY-YIG nuclease family protein [Sphingomonas]|uniref:GIY-YIG nuclease family protein n=1 Tax=Sphingomonas TaxID=13687 RepID=UPI000DEF94D3|nr:MULTISPECIES: GIY-YIG nuclease family protein [Sphingomonas]
MHFWVYIVRCSDGSFYTGHTDNLEKRVGEHNSGIGGDWTRRRRPVSLVWCEVLPTRQEAYEAERRIKPWSRAKKEGLIARDWARVSHFAKPPCERPSTSLGTSERVVATADSRAATGSLVPSGARGAKSRGASTP